MNSIDQSTEPQSQLRVDAAGVGGCGVRVMYGGGWGYSANKPKAIVQIDILLSWLGIEASISLESCSEYPVVSRMIWKPARQATGMAWGKRASSASKQALGTW